MRHRQYTLVDRVEMAAYKLFRLLPIDLASGFGAFLAKADCARCYWLGMEWTQVICNNLTRLTGETDAKALRRRLFRYAENTGRLRAEYAVLERLTSGERIKFQGLEHPKNANAPIIFVSAHISNWEVVAPAMAIQSIAMSPLYNPPTERGRREMLDGIRAKFAEMQPGQQLISATGNAMRKCVETLASGRNLIIYADEERDGLIWSPSFGRTLPNKGNRFLLARLALRFQATIIPVTCFSDGWYELSSRII